MQKPLVRRLLSMFKEQPRCLYGFSDVRKGLEVRDAVGWGYIYKGLIGHLRTLAFILSKVGGIRRF